MRPINRTVTSAMPRKNISSRGKLTSNTSSNLNLVAFIINSILLITQLLKLIGKNMKLNIKLPRPISGDLIVYL
tara:strand:+ start:162 stop:383 length:222 start_codon:yes stop_codon:yes gene_type:complete